MADKLTKQALAAQRKRLKVRLWRERGEDTWISARGQIAKRPRCAWCGEFIWFPEDCVMHEWLIKRSDLPVKLQHRIMVPCGCILLHVECHAQHGQTRECKLRCAKAMYERYGRNVIAAWVGGLGLRQGVEIPHLERGDFENETEKH